MIRRVRDAIVLLLVVAHGWDLLVGCARLWLSLYSGEYVRRREHCPEST